MGSKVKIAGRGVSFAAKGYHRGLFPALPFFKHFILAGGVAETVKKR